MSPMQVDANSVIDNLTSRLAQVERENAILTAQLQMLQEPKEVDGEKA